MSETRLAWVPAWFLLMGNVKLLEILLSKVRFWNKELKQCYPTSLLGFTLETSLTCHRPLIGRFTLRGRMEQFDTTSDRYWAACEVPSCIHGVLFKSFSSSQQHWCHKQTTRCTSEAPQADSNTSLSCILWNSITCSPADRISRNCHSLKKCRKSWLCPQDSVLGIDYISKSLSNGQGAFYSSPCLKLSRSLLWYIMYELLKMRGLCTFPPVLGVNFVLVW